MLLRLRLIFFWIERSFSALSRHLKMTGFVKINRICVRERERWIEGFFATRDTSRIYLEFSRRSCFLRLGASLLSRAYDQFCNAVRITIDFFWIESSFWALSRRLKMTSFVKINRELGRRLRRWWRDSWNFFALADTHGIYLEFSRRSRVWKLFR